MRIRFFCPGCEAPQRVDATAPHAWSCTACAHAATLNVPVDVNAQPLPACTLCGCHQVFRQKNFPQWLGISLLAAACGAFFILSGLYMRNLAWGILLGSAAFDGLLYLIVGDAIVCYRCGAKHTGLPKHRSYDPFELAIAEKYRQERLRRELALKK